MSDVNTDYRVTIVSTKKLFPITKSEAELLHELGWSSGYAWEDEWDWWPNDKPHTERDDIDVKMEFTRQVRLIRRFRAEADEAVKHYFRNC